MSDDTLRSDYSWIHEGGERLHSLGVVDTQVHLHQLVQASAQDQYELIVDAAVVAMDALGVDVVVIDEWIDFAGEGLHGLPGHRAANGAWRSENPLGEVAVARQPTRFAYMTRVDPLDPELPDVVARIGSTSGAAAIRIPASYDPAFAAGEYAALFDAAQTEGVPLMPGMNGQIAQLHPYLERFHEVPVVLDHAGIDHPKRGDSDWELDAALAPVLELAAYPNVLIKWEHPERISTQHYPFPDVIPALRSVVDAFGANRVMWASDTTAARNTAAPFRGTCTWAQSLHYVADSKHLSAGEKQWILGRTARETFALKAVAGPEPN